MIKPKVSGKWSPLFSPAGAALLYGAVAVIWLLSSGALLTMSVDDPVIQGRLELGKGLVFVLVTSVLLYLILRSFHRERSGDEYLPSASPAPLPWRILASVVLLGMVPLAAVMVVGIHKPQVERVAFSNLEAIADLKVSQVRRWLNERYYDDEVIIAVQGMAGPVAAILDMPSEAKPQQDALRRRLTDIIGPLHYDVAAVLDPHGNPLVQTGSFAALPDVLEMVSQALASGRTQFAGVVADAQGGMHFDLVVPLRLVENSIARDVGAVVLHESSERFRFPYLQQWPIASSSGEILLLRRGGEAFARLDESVRGKVSQEEWSAADGPGGLFNKSADNVQSSGWTSQGVDHRGVMALAAFRPIAGTDWILAAKLDRDEVLVPLHDLAFWVGVITLLAISVVGAVVLLFWQQRSRTHQLEILAQSNRLMRQLYDLPFIGIAMTSPETRRWVKCNDRFCEIMGYSREEILNLSWKDLTSPEDMAISEIENERVMRGESDGFTLDKRFIRKDGSIVYASVDVRCVRRADGLPEYILAMFQDITERKAAEAREHRLTRTYAALSECNKLIVRCRNQDELFSAICRIAVELGAMKMAWVGMLDELTHLVRPVASFGEGTAWLEGIQVSSDTQNPFGQGSASVCIREHRPVWIEDYQRDPMTAPWHELGRNAGWASSCTLPLERDGAVVGAFMLYSGERGAFDEVQRELLIEMAADISFALSNFAREVERNRMENQLRLSAKVFEQGGEGIMITDERVNIVMVNRAFEVITGYAQDEAIGRNPRFLASEKHDRDFYRAMWETINTGGFWQGEIWNRRKDGDVFPEYLSVSRVVDDQGRVTNYVGTFNDISESKASQEHIQRLAHYDSLTGLPNRILLADRVNLALSRMERSGQHLALIFLDLDRFKNVNDSLGHRVGDELLIQVAQRLKELLREEDTVSRLGGDEFILVLPAADEDGAGHVAGKVLKVLSAPYHIEQYELAVSASLGIAMYPDDGLTYEALSMCADTAMYRAKQSGRQTFRFFTREMQERSDRTLLLENALRRALELDQLHLHYQPQVSLESGRIIGVEALLRWSHPEFGEIVPADFVPVAEDSGMILPIGEWVLRSAVRQLREWLERGMPPLVMAVNLSAIQFRQANLPELISQILEEADLPPGLLELELTEGVAMENPLEAIAVMNDLHGRGVRMSIDDFGTGYSSLSYLKRFKVYKLKIDKSFVRDISRDPEDEAIVEAIIGLAESLGMQTIAEGVETDEQAVFLRAKGCNEGQGYFYSRPMPAEAFERFARHTVAASSEGQ